MRYGSVCSGIEAASVAWEPLGWKPAWFSEIEPFPSAVLAHHWPEVENLGDMTRITRRVLLGEVEAPDVLVGGTPCQAFSVAGMREGMADERGQLTMKYVELADAIDAVRVRAGDPESIVVWENVPGVLSDRQNAFGCFLGALAGEDRELQPAGKRWTNAGCVYGPQRAVAWRVLDAQYFGVAQRRRRVFLVASARAGFDPCAVLFECEGVRRDSPPSRGEEVSSAECAGRVAETPAGRGCYWDGGQVTQTLDTVLDKQQCMPEKSRFPAVLQPWRVTSPLNASTGKGKNGQDTQALVASAEGDSPAGVRRLTPVECERLQGFPDGHTEIPPWYACKCGHQFPEELGKYGCPNCLGESPARLRVAADGPRYKAIGNSMAVPVMQWIGERINAVAEEVPQ